MRARAIHLIRISMNDAYLLLLLLLISTLETVTSSEKSRHRFSTSDSGSLDMNE